MASGPGTGGVSEPADDATPHLTASAAVTSRPVANGTTQSMREGERSLEIAIAMDKLSEMLACDPASLTNLSPEALQSRLEEVTMGIDEQDLPRLLSRLEGDVLAIATPSLASSGRDATSGQQEQPGMMASAGRVTLECYDQTLDVAIQNIEDEVDSVGTACFEERCRVIPVRASLAIVLSRINRDSHAALEVARSSLTQHTISILTHCHTDHCNGRSSCWSLALLSAHVIIDMMTQLDCQEQGQDIRALSPTLSVKLVATVCQVLASIPLPSPESVDHLKLCHRTAAACTALLSLLALSDASGACFATLTQLLADPGPLLTSLVRAACAYGMLYIEDLDVHLNVSDMTEALFNAIGASLEDPTSSPITRHLLEMLEQPSSDTFASACATWALLAMQVLRQCAREECHHTESHLGAWSLICQLCHNDRESTGRPGAPVLCDLDCAYQHINAHHPALYRRVISGESVEDVLQDGVPE